MAIQIKSVDAATKKFQSRGGQAGADYSAGVASPRKPWQASASAAAPTYAAGVSAAVSNGSYAKGVNRAGDAKWSRKAQGVGSQRFGPGIQAAGPDYASGVAPYFDVIASVTLPPRGPKGDPGNNARVNAITQALRTKKTQG